MEAYTIMASQRRPISRSKPIDPTRASFLSLPGEIRNTIYSYVLQLEPHTDLHCDMANNRFYMQSWCRHSRLYRSRKVKGNRPRNVLLSLKVLGIISRQILHEAHTFFFFHNECIFVQVPDGKSHPPSIVSYANFLQGIETDSRSCIRHLNFWGFNQYIRESPPSLLDTERFFRGLSECTHLWFLQLRLDIESICLGDLPALKNFLYHNGPIPIQGLQDFVEKIRCLEKLSELYLTVTISKKYRNFRPAFDHVQMHNSLQESRRIMLNLEIFPNDRIQMLAEELAKMLKHSLSKTDGSEINIKMMYDHIPGLLSDTGKVI